MRLIPKNWSSFQHYKDRAPAWIKLHKALLDDYEFQCLPVASRALAPMLWLLASEQQDGVIDACAAKVAFRLRMTEDDFLEALKPLIKQGFFDDASDALASCKRESIPEKETYREEIEEEAEKNSATIALDVSRETPPSKLKRTPRDALCEVLDVERAMALIEHRNKLRAPLTVRAAELLAGQLGQARAGPAAAADLMLERGWRGFRQDWVKDDGKRNNANGKPQFSGVVANLRDMLDEAADGDRARGEPDTGLARLEDRRRSGAA